MGWRVCWVLPLLRQALCVATAEASIGLSSSRSAWLSTGASLASESVYREHDATQSASFLDSSLEAIDAIPEDGRPVGFVGVDVEAATNNPLSNSKLGGYRTSAVATGLGAALALLFCLFLMGTGGQRRSGPRADALGKTDARLPLDAPREGGIFMRAGKERDKSQPGSPPEETERRLEEVRKLLPAASRLASVVDSDETQILLAKVKENVEHAYQLKGKVSDDREPNDRLDRALEALRTLHRTAILHAEVLIKTGGEIPTFSMLDSSEESVARLTAIEKDMEEEGVLTFIKYLRVLDESILNICRKFSEARNEISTERYFVDETDGEVLAALTDKIEWLRGLENRKRHAVDVALQLEQNMLYAVRTLLFEVHEDTLLRDEGDLGIAKALAAAAGGDNGANGDKETQDDAATQPTNTLSSPSDELEMAEVVLGKLRANLKTVPRNMSLSDILSANRTAEELEAQAGSLLLKCWPLTMDHPHPAEIFRPNIHNMLKDVALKAYWRAVSEKGGLRVTVRTLQAANAEPSGSSEVASSPIPHLNAVLAARLRDSAEDISQQAEKYYSEAKALVEALHSLRETQHMVSHVQKVTATVSPLVKLKNKCCILMLGNCLLKVLDMDIVFSMELAARASSSGATLSHSDQSLLKNLQASFDAAQKAAKEANTIEGAVEAAAIMREKAESMEELVIKQGKALLHH